MRHITPRCMEIIPLGDSALILRLDEDFEKDPEKALQAVLRAQRCVEGARLHGVIECAPAYDSMAVFFDPAQFADAAAFTSLTNRIVSLLENLEDGEASALPVAAVEIPVCYDTEFAPDLEEVAKYSGLSATEVVRRHSAADYRVHGLGFTPGFPYLGGLPPELAVPRRKVPRKKVPAGSVAIGGVQTGIYPSASPGGWHLIGRTPLALFDAERDPPALLQAGMRVRFCEITRAEFDAALS